MASISRLKRSTNPASRASDAVSTLMADQPASLAVLAKVDGPHSPRAEFLEDLIGADAFRIHTMAEALCGEGRLAGRDKPTAGSV